MTRYLKSFVNPSDRKPLEFYRDDPIGIPFTMTHAFQGVANTSSQDIECSRTGCGMVEAATDALPGVLAVRTDITYTFAEYDDRIVKYYNSPAVQKVVAANDTLAMNPDPNAKAEAVRTLTSLVGRELTLRPITSQRLEGARGSRPSVPAVKPQGPRPARGNRTRNPYVRTGVGRSRTTERPAEKVAAAAAAFSRPSKFERP